MWKPEKTQIYGLDIFKDYNLLPIFFLYSKLSSEKSCIKYMNQSTIGDLE